MAETTERLLLQVDAATELLRRNLIDAEQPLDRFERRAAKMSDNVDRSIADMGKRFGAFAELAEDASKRAQRSFEASFSDIQKLAAKAIQGPTATGGLNVGAADAKAAAAAAQRQALATRLIADAAERAAQGEGVLTEQTRLYVQAARAAAIEADRNAQSLTREAGALERLEIELLQAGAGSHVFANGQSRVVVQSGAVRAAMQGAAYQVQDTFTQLSMGGNLLQVVAIQGGQLAGQFANIEGKAGTLARFMIGPAGLALTGILLILGPLTKGMLDFGDAVDDAVTKLKDDAKESETTARAKERFKTTLEGVTQAIRDQAKALDDAAAAERTSAERANIAAKQHAQEALDIRKKTAARLADAIAARDGFSPTTGGASTVALAQAGEAARVVQLQDQLKAADAEVAKAQVNLNLTRVDLAAEQAAVAVDPVRSVTKLYDDRIKALKDQQREEAKLGRIVGNESRKRLIALEQEKKKAVEAAQARVNAARRTNTANRQFGREVDVAGATAIIESIGGHVTSGLRSTARQAQLYADAQAGRHIGPVARPGTSAHERGGAIDVRYGRGISVASIRKAFLDAGVSLRKILNEPTQGVYHVEFGKAGPSASAIAKREDAARKKVLRDDTAYNEDVLRARRKLIDASSRSAISEEQRASLLRDEINAEADTEKTKVANRLKAGEINVAQAVRLDAINEAARQQRLENVDADRAHRIIGQRYDAQERSLSADLANLRIRQDLAITDRERKKIALDILETEQKLRRQALEKIRDTSDDPVAVQNAKDDLKRLPTIERGERDVEERRSAGPLDQYRERLHAATDDMNAALEQVKANGLESLESGLVGIISGTESVGSAFKKMAQSIIADLARIVVQKAILGALPGVGKFLGYADGGPLGGVPGRADGGSLGGLIRGPGNGRSDSILALLSGPGGGAVRLSNREFIMNERAVNFYGPETLAALNARQLPRFADGGMLSRPQLPSLRTPRLPNFAGADGRRNRVDVTAKVDVEASPLLLASVQQTAVQTVGAAAEPIMAGSEARVMRSLRRPSLPGAPG